MGIACLASCFRPAAGPLPGSGAPQPIAPEPPPTQQNTAAASTQLPPKPCDDGPQHVPLKPAGLAGLLVDSSVHAQQKFFGSTGEASGRTATAGPSISPLVLELQRELATLSGPWVTRLDRAVGIVREFTGATAVSLAMLSELHDSFVVLARTGSAELVLPPGTCIAVTEAAANVQSLDDGEQHSLQCMYQEGRNTLRHVVTGTAPKKLPLDWAHLHATAGITHFAALPLFHGASIVGALTILGTAPAFASANNTAAAAGTAATALSPAMSGSLNPKGWSIMSSPPMLQAVSAGGVPGATVAQLFDQPMSLELLAAGVAQACLGPDRPFAQHVCALLQTTSVCASLQQLVGCMTLGVQSVLAARLCLALRCSVALAVEQQPNALMFEEVTHGADAVVRGLSSNLHGNDSARHTPKRMSLGANVPYDGAVMTAGNAAAAAAVALAASSNKDPGGGGSARCQSTHLNGGVVGAAPRMYSGNLHGGGGGHSHNNTMDGNDIVSASGVHTAAGRGNTTTCTLVHRVMARRFKARPFSVYHTLLIQTIHNLGNACHNGTVVLHCHDHMQDAKTPSRDMYALGQGAGLPPQSLVLAVAALRPYEELSPTTSTSAEHAHAATQAAFAVQSRSVGSDGAAPGAVLPPARTESSAGLGSPRPIWRAPSASRLSPAAHAVAAEPTTYLALYVASSDPLPATLLESVLVELDALARHMLSPLIYHKLLAGGDLSAEWQLLQAAVAGTNSVAPGTGSNSGPGGQASEGLAKLPSSRQGTARLDGAMDVATAALTAAGVSPAAAAGKPPPVVPAVIARNPAVSRAGSTLSNAGGPYGALAQPKSARRMSSLQRIMLPYLTSEVPELSAQASASAISPHCTSLHPHVGDPSSSMPDAAPNSKHARPHSGTHALPNIRRTMHSPSGCGRGTINSENFAREVLLAAAAAAANASHGGAVGGAHDSAAVLSTELAGSAGHDTHAQMGLLLTSYRETLHSMHMEMASMQASISKPVVDAESDDPGRLVLREVLGKGGHGVVFRGTMHTLEVAIKVFQIPGEDDPLVGGAASRPEVVAEALLQRRRVLSRAALELAIMGSTGHPNIVQVYAQWPSAVLERDESQPCRRRLKRLAPNTPMPPPNGLLCAVMCMEYCDKGTLVDAINRGDFLQPTRDNQGFKPHYKAIYTTLLEMTLALRHIHSMGITHCDLKPANVLLKSSPRDPRGFTTKLADFGYAALLKDASPDGHRSVVTDEACGTVTHMAPEMFVEGEPVDSSGDVYALGIIMWELVSGKQPYHDRNLKALPHEVVNKGLRPSFPPNVPEVYKTMAKSCWSPLPRQRPTAAALVSVIQAQLDKIEAVARLLGRA